MKYANEMNAMQPRGEAKIALPDNLADMIREDRMMSDCVLNLAKRVNRYLFGPGADETGLEPETECFRDEVMQTGFKLKEAIDIMERMCQMLGA